MHDMLTATLPLRSSSILRNSTGRIVSGRERKARDYLGRAFPALDRDPFGTRHDRRESLFEVDAPARA